MTNHASLHSLARPFQASVPPGGDGLLRLGRDSGAAHPVAGPGDPAPTAKLAKAASDFEAMAISQLLQPMFDTVKPGPFGGGKAEEAWKPIMIQELGKQIAAHRGIGLAQPVYAAMLRMQEGKR